MALLDNLTVTQNQADAVYAFEQACKAMRDATVVHTSQTAPDWKWKLWFEAAEGVREVGLDPLDYANVKRGVK